MSLNEHTMENSASIETYVQEVIRPLLPNARPVFWSSINGKDIRLKLFETNQFSKTPFEFDFNKDLEFLHFTSISNLSSILRSRNLRLSDLNSLSDKHEFNFANSYLNTKPDLTILRELKSSIFTLSLCDYSTDILNDINMWQSYGRDCLGACLRIKLHHQRGLPQNYYLNKIIYHPKEPITELIELKERHIKFIDKYGWAISNLDECLNILSNLYKTCKYCDEKEIRLTRYVRKDATETHDNDYSNIGVQFDEKLDVLNYFFELPLNQENKDFPLLTIEEIYICDTILNTNSIGTIQQILNKQTNKNISVIDPR